jgi:squalene cyclase
VTQDAAGAARALAGLLVRDQQADGGWAVRAGGPGNVETTALAALALHAADPAVHGAAVDRAVGWLAGLQRPDGGWPATAQVPQSTWTTAPAALALSRLGREPARVRAAVGWLTAREGLHADPGLVARAYRFLTVRPAAR